MTAAILELGQAVAGIRAFLVGHYAPQPQAQLPPPPPPPPSVAITAPVISYQYGMPYDGTAPTSFPAAPPPSQGVPIQQIRFPPSPSPLPAWIADSSQPIYTATSTQPHLPPFPTTGPVIAHAHGGAPTSGVLYGGVDGPLFHGSLMPTFSTASPSLDTTGAAPWAAAQDPPPPKFYKLEFATYDGSVDPLNWLNQCEQFFRGQRTLASDRTWLASYHLRGAAQTWYYALEQDEGMPSWERFKELCNLRFGPAVRNTRLSELARMPFTSTVQDYSDRFNAVLCHARHLSAPQKAELFVGGLPEHIKVDVELREPQDLQTAMHLARAFERRAAATLLAPVQQAWPPQR
jgi:hypothetical protein